MSTDLFSELIGNFKIKSLLNTMLSKKAIGNSLLFSGPQGVGKGCFAKQFAKALLGTAYSTDLMQLYPEGKVGLHSVESLRSFSEQVYLAPFEAKWKVFIIHDVERMYPVSYNALLKTFEEPAKDAVIILTTSAQDKVAPTLFSRCRIFPFHRVSEEEIANWLQEKHQLTKKQALLISERADGSPARALKLLSKNDLVEEKLLSALSTGALFQYATAHQVASEIAEIIEFEMNEFETPAPKEFTATQVEMHEKNCQGLGALQKRHRFDACCELLLSWFRDVELQDIQGAQRFLTLKQYQDQTKNSRRVPFQKLEKAIKDSKLSLERSTTLSLCFENLFLQMQ